MDKSDAAAEIEIILSREKHTYDKERSILMKSLQNMQRDVKALLDVHTKCAAEDIRMQQEIEKLHSIALQKDLEIGGPVLSD